MSLRIVGEYGPRFLSDSGICICIYSSYLYDIDIMFCTEGFNKPYISCFITAICQYTQVSLSSARRHTFTYMSYAFPKRRILDSSKLKEFADNNSLLRAISLFPTVFSKDLYSRLSFFGKGFTELQIYGAPAPMTQDFIKWHTTFQANAPIGRILFGCE